jgi:uncharacterized membrane protein
MSDAQPAGGVGDILDLVGVGVVAVVVTVTIAVGGRMAVPIRVAGGMVLVLFAPGYALVALLLPRRTTASADGSERSVTGGERLLLSLGLSAVVVSLVGLGLNYTTWGIDQYSLPVAVGVTTLVLTPLAMGRRLLVEPAGRFPSYSFGTPRRLARRVGGDGSWDAVVSGAVVVGLVVAVAGVGLGVATTENDEQYTEFYLLSENESGELVADDYPSELTRGEPAVLHVGIGNHEGEPVEYAVVVQLQRIERDDGRATVAERTGVGGFQVTLGPGETVERRHAVEPTVDGESFRLTYLLYTETPPPNPSRATAYRSVHLWVDVTPPGGTS